MRDSVKDPVAGEVRFASADREIRIERIFSAPRDRVWRAFTEPSLVAQWWCRGNPLEVERLEVAEGGRWRFVERGEGWDRSYEGHFREVVPLERLVYTLSCGDVPGRVALEAVHLEGMEDGRTRVITVARFHTTRDRDDAVEAGAERGANESFTVLARLLATSV